MRSRQVFCGTTHDSMGNWNFAWQAGTGRGPERQALPGERQNAPPGGERLHPAER